MDRYEPRFYADDRHHHHQHEPTRDRHRHDGYQDHDFRPRAFGPHYDHYHRDYYNHGPPPYHDQRPSYPRPSEEHRIAPRDEFRDSRSYRDDRYGEGNDRRDHMHNDPLTVPDHHVPSLVAGLHLHSKDLVPRRGVLRNSQENPDTLPQVEGNLQKRDPVLNIDLKMLCLLIQREKMLGSRLEMMTVFAKALVPVTMMIVTTMTVTGPLLTSSRPERYYYV